MAHDEHREDEPHQAADCAFSTRGPVIVGETFFWRRAAAQA